MPQLVHSWLQRLLPAWFLPSSLVLKERNPDKVEGYENEIDTYLHLRSLQGTHIPRFFGEVAVAYPERQTRYRLSKRPTPGILLENIEGVSLQSLQIQELESPTLVEELQGVYDQLTREGIVHGDPRLHNFLRRASDKRIVAIDFEFSYPLPSDITNQDALETLKSEIEKRGRWRIPRMKC
ncbi:hypothetical protein N0V88_006164 [Collariella sp. IMI 366227]|nr:hypothetical protein N0V88_006164 [Collariella sp. IMI 366227]